MVRRVVGLLAMIVLFSTVSMAFAGDEKFPHRKDFPNVPTIETQDLHAALEAGELIVFDVRSSLEYEVIHVDVAKFLPVSDDSFEAALAKIVKENPGKKLAFYCNGTTCLKAYKAAERSLKAGNANSFAYDAGIPEWANAYPSQTTLLSKAITNPAEQIITKSQFKSKCMKWNVFKNLGGMSGALVIDVRDPYQKSESLPGLEKALDIPLAEFLTDVVANKKYQDKNLLIFDQVGKQVRWLQYHMRENGYTNYIFLDGGSMSILKKQGYK